MSEELKPHRVDCSLYHLATKEHEAEFKDLTAQLTQYKAALENNEKLKEFATNVIKTECWGIIPLDGLEVHELACGLGLIAEHIATEKDVDDYSDFEVGDPIYKFTQALSDDNPESEDKNN